MKKLLIGNEALARGFYEGGIGVVSSYPGTPSTEITEYLSAYRDIYSEWAPNEKWPPRWPSVHPWAESDPCAP